MGINFLDIILREKIILTGDLNTIFNWFLYGFFKIVETSSHLVDEITQTRDW